MPRIITCLLFLLLNFSLIKSQNNTYIDNDSIINNLDSLYKTIYSADTYERWDKSDIFSSYLISILKNTTINDLEFQEIENLQYFSSGDKKLIIFNWGIPNENGSVGYCCITKVWSDSLNKYIINSLNDISAYNPFPEKFVYRDNNWWGALYYTLIEKQIKNTTYYTLLGWNTSQNTYRQKVIEVCKILPNGKVEFGCPIFRNTNNNRFIFRFNPKVDMILRYDYQAYRIKKGKKEKLIKDNMIVFDRLIPEDNNMEGQYSNYVAVGNLYDAFVFINGAWELKLDVVARNQ